MQIITRLKCKCVKAVSITEEITIRSIVLEKSEDTQKLGTWKESSHLTGKEKYD